jgi:hypothetical protein
VTLVTGTGFDRSGAEEKLEEGWAEFQGEGSEAAGVLSVLMGVAARHCSSSATDRAAKKPSASNKPVAFKLRMCCPSMAGGVPVPSRDDSSPYFDTSRRVRAIVQLVLAGKMKWAKSDWAISAHPTQASYQDHWEYLMVERENQGQGERKFLSVRPTPDS